MDKDGSYLRISQDREAQHARAQGKDDEALADLNSSLIGQRRACRAKARQLGSSDPTEFLDFDKSATKGKPREGYKALIAAIERGEVKRVIVLHLSRLWRNRRERAAGIDIMRRHGVTIVAVKGPELDLSSAYGRLAADIFGAFDSAESEVKSERLDEWQTTRSEAGLHNGTPPYGYRLAPTGKVKADGTKVMKLVQVPAEASQVKAWYRRVLAGESLMSVAASAGIVVQVLKVRLCSPTYAGLRVHKGVEYPAAWKAIVELDSWRAVVAKVEGKRTGPNGGRTLLGGIARCGRCDVAATATWDKAGAAVYRCNINAGGCGRSFRRETLNTFVDGLVIERLGRSDARSLLAKPDAPDLEDLLAEAQGIRARLRGLAKDHVLTGLDMTEAVEAGNARLKEIEALTSSIDEVLGAVLDARDPGKAYASMTIPQKQAVIRRLMTITLLAPPRGRTPKEVMHDPDAAAALYVSRCVQVDWHDNKARRRASSRGSRRPTQGTSLGTKVSAGPISSR